MLQTAKKRKDEEIVMGANVFETAQADKRMDKHVRIKPVTSRISGTVTILLIYELYYTPSWNSIVLPM